MPPNNNIESLIVQDVSSESYVSKRIIPISVTRDSREIPFYVKLIVIMAPLLLYKMTNVIPMYITLLLRVLCTHLFMSLHFLLVDKDNYLEKISQKQLLREKKDYLVGFVLHMWAQLALQLLFPQMFFNSSDMVYNSMKWTLLVHVLLVEPLYYAVHRWLHLPINLKSMHGHHHMSVNTIPSTSLVQNFQEHFIYVATFGPAMIFPYFISGYQHWIVIMGYLVLFDIVNAFGHTNIKCRGWIFESYWSPLKYLFYTPEFHLGHHAFFNYNYGLFMPIWDHLLGTFKDYKKNNPMTVSQKRQDFVFIGHNGGLGHLLTVPEYSIYNIYDKYYRTFLPIEIEFIFMNILTTIVRLFASSYSVSRYLVDGQYIGRIVVILRSPIDYIYETHYNGVNKDIVNVIRQQYEAYGTTYFGLGNLNKMKQVNDGGSVIVKMIQQDSYLKDKNIRVWTGDTMTTASVYNQIISLPKLDKVFYIGANGKIGKAVCLKLSEKGIPICIFSTFTSLFDTNKYPNITFTQDITDMRSYKYVVIGKLLHSKLYRKALKQCDVERQYLLDYTVPHIPLVSSTNSQIRHIQIGVLETTNNNFLKGYFDICMGTDQNQIYPCHAGCIINMVEKRSQDETGDIDVDEIDSLWSRALKYGLDNKQIHIA